MATKEAVWDVTQLMASVWKFPKEDLGAVAAAYQLALRDLSDDQVKMAVTALMSSWTKREPPKPADILKIASEFKPPSKTSPRLPPREPSHDEILHKIRRDTYASHAIIEVVGEHKPFDRWTEDQKRAVAKRQAELRAEVIGREP